MELTEAVAGGEIEVWYQPQVEARSLRVAGFEALARWNHPSQGLLTPDAFVPAHGAAADALAAFVLERACEEAARWPDVTVAVNMSPRHFAHRSFVDEVAQAMARAGLAPERLELEILETSAFEEPALAKAAMTRLRDMGVGIAIDDFGQGYSRQSLLLDLPVSKIKLAHAIVTDPASGGWIGDFVRTTHALGMKVTAEGVETQAQADAMTQAGCDYLQGYFFARPAPGAAITAALNRTPDPRP